MCKDKEKCDVTNNNDTFWGKKDALEYETK
jgi:hypothetical protein